MGDLFDSAVFSDDEVYRYVLTRELGGERPLVICGLNPSTATATKNDPTITREIDFARRWECGRLWKINAYAFRETKPKIMFAAKKSGRDIIGPDNDLTIREAAELAKRADGIFLVAWGRNVERTRAIAIENILRDVGVTPMCIKTNADGSPIHPLYQPKTSKPFPWRSR